MKHGRLDQVHFRFGSRSNDQGLVSQQQDHCGTGSVILMILLFADKNKNLAHDNLADQIGLDLWLLPLQSGSRDLAMAK